MFAIVARRPYTALILAGLASATGFAPLQLFPVTIVALALLMWLVHNAPSLKAALLRGWIFGVAHFTVGNNWIQHAFDFQDKMPPVLGYFAVVALALYLAIYPAMAAGLAWRLASPRAVGDGETAPGGSYVLIFAATWIATEWLRATMFTGYAWNPVAVIWLPLISIARISAFVGTYALSGITVAVAGSLMLLVGWRRWRMPVIAAGGLLLSGVLASAQPVPGHIGPDAPRVRVVQPNVGQAEMQFGDYDPKILQAMIDLSGRPQRHPRLIVWPEGAVNYYLESGYPREWYWKGTAPVTRGRIAALLGPNDMALVGSTAIEFDKSGELMGAGNSIFTVDPAGKLGPKRYDKAHLVPYGEYLPMRPILSKIGLSRLVAGDIDYLPGPGPQTIEVPGFGSVGMQICYEIIFSGRVVDAANRPDFLFNPSNDGWFGKWGPPQHLAQARLRAIEEGLPVIRSTPTGISAVIDAQGRLIATIGMDRAGAIEAPAPVALPPTLFARMGNLMALAMVVLLVGLAIAIRRRER